MTPWLARARASSRVAAIKGLRGTGCQNVARSRLLAVRFTHRQSLGRSRLGASDGHIVPLRLASVSRMVRRSACRVSASTAGWLLSPSAGVGRLRLPASVQTAGDTQVGFDGGGLNTSSREARLKHCCSRRHGRRVELLHMLLQLRQGRHLSGAGQRLLSRSLLCT
jgi:hypothetical protein